MRIGIIDADLIGRKKHRFPNLACMKMSAFYKQQGHDVRLLRSYNDVRNYDKVFVSKVFTDTEVPCEVLNLDHVKRGGTGFFYDKADPLPFEVEHTKPDYTLYDEFVRESLERGVSAKDLAYYTDYSIGFATRGCIRGCSFCVNKNYKRCSLHSPISEFMDDERKYICLLDDNVLACNDWKQVFEELNATGKRYQFKQGMDERLLTSEKCKVVFSAKWIGDYIFAFDNIAERDVIEKKLELIRQYTNIVPKFYCFCGYNHDAPEQYDDEFWKRDVADLFERIKILFSYKALPYIMRYKDYGQSPYKGIYITVARWCNQPSFAKKKTFREFCEANGENSSAMKYLRKFENDAPEIARKYFDMRWNCDE